MPQLHKAGIAVGSIHGHTSSTDLALSNSARIATRLLQVGRNHNLNQLRYFNVCGWFFGAPAQGLDVSGKPTYADYAARLAQVLRGDAWFQAVQPTLVVEPGVSVVANVFDFVTRVHTVKHIDGQSYVVVEGSVFDKIGRAHVLTPVTNAHLVCRLLLEKKNNTIHTQYTYTIP